MTRSYTKPFPVLLTLALLSLYNATFAQAVVDEWKYTLRRPQGEWQQADFDDSQWRTGSGGFGTLDTPGARVGTRWASNRIWLRKSFQLQQIPQQPALMIHHDEDVEVFLNGHRILELKGYTSDYKVLPIPTNRHDAIVTGRNVLAVHCRQTTGGQFIDVHLIDSNQVPELPLPKRDTKPFQSELITKWGEQVTPENAWQEYPRPQLRRDQWTNLNGQWDYAVTKATETTVPATWAGNILVPFCLESKLGGVSRLLEPDEALWYRREFEAKPSTGKRLLLHFEAVDYRCEVFVNGQSVGQHVGGNTPFTFEISSAVREGNNELVVRVEDATEAWQLRGKQTLSARGIWYTQVSGIWQTVWLEEVPDSYIAKLKITTSAKDHYITVVPGYVGGGGVMVTVKDGDRVVARRRGGNRIEVPVEQPRLWSPSDPHLYDVIVTLLGPTDRPIDTVTSYAGIRDVGKVKDAGGHWRFTLNGKPIFHWGPLDQGWWPDGLLTPPSDAAMLSDIQWLRSAGFNMIRKHIKVEPRRYYYHCDRLGMMVWQDHVSGGTNRLGAFPEWTRLKPNPHDSEWPDEQHAQFMLELERMITTLESHPSIVSWVPFNERWGQHRTMKVGKWTVDRDPTRLVNVASGGNFWPVGDVVDAHSYPHPAFPFEDGEGGRFDDFIKVMGEFGGHGLPVKDHLWDANRRNWGYGDLPQNAEEYRNRYVDSLNLLNELRRQGIAAGVYTQTTDVEGEINGLLTYDRKVTKIPAKELAELHKVLFRDP